MISFVSVFLRLKKIASNLLRGFAMGIADVVPGVSGGTIALVLGIYEQLLENISNLVVKEVDGSGGYGMLIGPKSTKETIQEFSSKLKNNPKG